MFHVYIRRWGLASLNILNVLQDYNLKPSEFEVRYITLKILVILNMYFLEDETLCTLFNYAIFLIYKMDNTNNMYLKH